MQRFSVHIMIILSLLFSAKSRGAEPVKVVVTPTSFDCPKEWEQIGHSHYTNVLGDLAGTLSAAQSPTGQDYPAGTIVQMQPTEAMVKREAGFSPDTNDWEFFKLRVRDGETTILARGTISLGNIAGRCASCHADAETFDFVCGETHGCRPLPKFVIHQAARMVARDSRCVISQ